MWEQVVDVVGDGVAIRQGDRRVTYREFDDAAARFAGALEAAGLKEGAKVALYLYNSPEYLIAQFGAFKHRCVPVNVNFRYLDDELVYLLDNADAEALVYHSSLSACVARVRDRLTRVRLFVEVDDGDANQGATTMADLLAATPPQARKNRSPEDLYMLYTGGTTGLPKGVMFPQGEFIDRLMTSGASLGLIDVVPSDVAGVRAMLESAGPSSEVSIPCCPLMHGTGMWIGAMPALMLGGSVVLLESRTFDPDEVWRLCERWSVTRVVIVGDAFARPLVRSLEAREREGRAVDTSSVRHVISSGAIWSAEMKDALRTRMTATLVDSLGSTEGLGFGASGATHEAGAPTAHFALAPSTKVVSEDGREIAPGTAQTGMLASRTAAFAYYKDPEKSARTFIRLNGQGYVLTGDWARVDADGTITLLGRGSMSINTGGEKVFAEEVEEAIKRHPLVDDCLVVGVADERFGQRVVAIIGTSEMTLSDEDLRTFLRESLAHFKIPRTFVVRESVQRAPNGKADYKWAHEVASRV
jgi:fatty-acyl-CoA synthase